MGFAAAAGMGAQAAGAYLGNKASKDELTKQGFSNDAYQGAYGQTSAENQAEEDALQGMLGKLSDQHFGNYNALSAALGNGAARGSAGTAASGANDARISSALAQAKGSTGALAMHPDTGVAGTAANDWAQRAQDFYAPQLSASRGLSDAKASARGQSAYDAAAQNQFQQSETANATSATQAQQQANLMRQFFNNQLSDAQRQYSYGGPSNGFYNQQLVGQSLGTLGGAIQSYGGSRGNPSLLASSATPTGSGTPTLGD